LVELAPEAVVESEVGRSEDAAVSLEFLAPDAAAAAEGFVPVARSPMERQARAAGARFEVRDGWSVAVTYSGEPGATGWADMSHLGKLEVHRPAVELELGRATRINDAWWCPLTPERALVICEPAATAAVRERLEDVVEVTTAYAALTIVGPHARDIFARFTAADLRFHVTPINGFRPVSVARTPGMILREAEDRYLMLFGAAFGQYMWTTVADAAEHLGGAAMGVDVLRPVTEQAHA
jgi:heterotetrameric sarcosine oxidase gamma subunit